MSEKRRGNFISLWTKISNNSTEFLTISREIVGYLVQLPHKIQNIKNIKVKWKQQQILQTCNSINSFDAV